MTISLRSIPLPDFEIPLECPQISASEYATRADELYRQAGLDWVAVYGDREHNANLLFLTGFDPRFEEGLLLLGPDSRRYLLVGNEGVIHVQDAGLDAEVVLYQPFSLMAQPRGTSPSLHQLLRNLGIADGASVGIVGWKYFAPGEDDEGPEPAYVPVFVNRAISAASGSTAADITAALMAPDRGLRSAVSASEIARMEWGAARSSAAVLRVVASAQPGMTELEAIGSMGYQGEPLQCHCILASTDTFMNGLRSPGARTISYGDALSCGVGYWGGLCCRAGLMSDQVDEKYFNEIVTPYFSAIATWWESIRVGITGGELFDRVIAALGDATFRPMLNPGHLGSYDEWVHSPIFEGSTMPLRSGMVLQCDIIPTPLPSGTALNCEDTVALADESLRREIAAGYPELWARIEARRAFIKSEIGIDLSDDVLPLSHAATYLAPFWLKHDLVCTLSG